MYIVFYAVPVFFQSFILVCNFSSLIHFSISICMVQGCNIWTIMFNNTVTIMLGLAKFLTIRERRRFELISTSQEFIPNTNPGIPREGSLRSPLVQLKSTIHGFSQHRTIRDNQLLGRLGLACPWAHVWLPTHPYYHLECALLQNGPDLS